LWEKELTPPEERIVREHLSSCRECREQFKGFEKTMEWLRSIGEAELPNGFLPELQKKMEERKGRAILAEKTRGRWLGLPVSLKLPAQALAMVAIVFLVLYLAKMMPTEMYRLKDGNQTAPSLSAEKKSEQVWAPKGMERDQRASETTPEPGRSKDVEWAKTPPPREEMEEAHVPRVKVESKKMEEPSPGTGVMGYRKFDSKEPARAQAPSPEAEGIEKGLVAKEKSIVAAMPAQEIVLRISDREKTISQLHELVRQFGGEMVTAEGNMVVASLPNSSFSEFEKELTGLSTSTKADKVAAKKQVMGSGRAVPGGKRKEVGEKSEVPAKSAIDQDSRTVVRILLIQE
jgi:hypothetical protein